MGFRQADYVRAVKAATAAGLRVYQTEIHPDGRIVLIHHEVGIDAPIMPTEAERAAERERRRQILRDLKAKFVEEAKQKTAERRRARDAEKAAADAARKSRTHG